jgi:malate synthase
MFETTLIAQHLNQTETELEQLISEIRQTITEWYETLRVVEGSNMATNREQREVIRQATYQARDYIERFYNLKKLRRTLRRGMYFILRNRQTNRIEGIIRGDFLDNDVHLMFPTVFPQQLNTVNRTERLIFQLNQASIKWTAITERSARVIKKLKFERTDL